MKFDSHTQMTKCRLVHALSPAEPIFVPIPEGTTEDGVVLLSVVLDGMSGKRYLLVMDVRTFVKVGRAQMQTVVGFGFHGHFPGGEE